MAIRKQASISLDTHRDLKALEFCTGRSSDDLIAEGLRRVVEAAPDLATRVAQAKRAAA